MTGKLFRTCRLSALFVLWLPLGALSGEISMEEAKAESGIPFGEAFKGAMPDSGSSVLAQAGPSQKQVPNLVSAPVDPTPPSQNGSSRPGRVITGGFSKGKEFMARQIEESKWLSSSLLQLGAVAGLAGAIIAAFNVPVAIPLSLVAGAAAAVLAVTAYGIVQDFKSGGYKRDKWRSPLSDLALGGLLSILSGMVVIPVMGVIAGATAGWGVGRVIEEGGGKAARFAGKTLQAGWEATNSGLLALMEKVFGKPNDS